ncbi:hypothetical protein SY83_21865 [Paenibacillus swuensis]|uniref:Carbohydrate-binding domain-containing protein n=1 Tax=Paenibacillus swuensis TaxID=1178515 RepID=A0A172TN26_9BACL|nr:sugar-binding protein [Paenibacillus swuensis]ANE48489.1 hypothetical protein SY83_21865 [Paenibacillus swuensis]
MKKLSSICLVVSMLLTLIGGLLAAPQVSSAAVNGADQYEWGNVPVGGGGYVTGIVIHPVEPDLMYARTDVGGAFRWDADEQQWHQMLSFLGPDQVNLYSVDGIALSKTNPNVVYVALGGYQGQPGSDVYKSTDRGETWQKTNLNKINYGGDQVIPNGNERVNGESLAVDPNNDQIIYAGTRLDGLWVSKNGAVNWTQIPTSSVPAGSPNRGIRNIVFDPNSPVVNGQTTVMYIGVQGQGIYKTVNAGASWQLMAGSPIKPKRIQLASDGSIYVAAGGTEWGFGNQVVDASDGIFVFRNGNWSNISPMPGEKYGAIGVDPDDPNFLIVTEFKTEERTFYVSKNGGASWSDVTNKHIQNRTVPWWQDWAFNMLTNQIEFDPHNGSVWFTGGFGVWETKEIHADTVNWYTRVNGIEETVAVDLIATSKTKLIAAVADVNGFAYENLTEFPVKPFNADVPGMPHCNTIDFSEANPDFVACNGGYSTDGGRAWQKFESWPFADGGRIAVSADVKANGMPVLVYLPVNDIPYRSTDMGKTWVKTTAPASQAMRSVWENRGDQLVSDRNVGDKFYLYDKFSGKLFRSDNSGAQWSEVNASLPVIGQWNWVLVSTIKGKPGYVWVSADVAGGGAYLSTNYGNTFTKVPNIDRVRNFTYGKHAPGTTVPALYVRGVINGVEGFFRSDNGGTSWIRINNDSNKLGIDMHTIVGDPNVYGKVYLATSNTGIMYGQIIGTNDSPENTIKQTVSPVIVDGVVNEGMWQLQHTLTKLSEGVNTNVVKFDTLWDDEYLYAAVKVYDKHLVRDSSDYYHDDSVEIYIDADNSKEGAYGTDSRQISVTFDQSAPHTAQNSNGIITAVSAVQGGYTFEMAVPWSNLGITPQSGHKIGFDVANNEDANGANRDGVLLWNGDGNNWQSNANFGELTLTSERIGNKGEYLSHYISGGAPVSNGLLTEPVWNLAGSIGKVTSGLNDNAVTFDAVWDDQNLYVAASVMDHAVIKDSTEVYMDDSIEIYIDGNYSKNGAYDAFDRQITIGALGSGIVTSHPSAGITGGASQVSGGYTIELTVPWINLGIQPEDGMRIGLDIGNNDDDTGVAREGVRMWNGTDSNWQDTSKFGTLYLDGNVSVNDDADDFSKTFSTTGNLYISDWNADVFGDPRRFSPLHANTAEEYAVVYATNGHPLTHFSMLATRGAAVTNGPYRIYVSANNTQYTEVTPTIKVLGYPGNQELAEYTMSDLPAGMHYIKIVYPKRVNAQQLDNGLDLHILKVSYGMKNRFRQTPSGIYDTAEVWCRSSGGTAG